MHLAGQGFIWSFLLEIAFLAAKQLFAISALTEALFPSQGLLWSLSRWGLKSWGPEEGPGPHLTL